MALKVPYDGTEGGLGSKPNEIKLGMRSTKVTSAGGDMSPKSVRLGREKAKWGAIPRAGESQDV